MELTERIALLRSSAYFARLDEYIVERVARECVVQSLAPGQLIFSEGDSEGAAALHFVADGVVRIFKVSLEGREQVLRLMQAGDSFADVAAFDGGPYPANADAFERVTLLRVPRQILWSALSEHPTMALGALQIMAGRLRHMTSLVEDLSLRRVASRVAKHLLDDAAPVQLNQTQLAALLGASREMINRSLHALVEDGSIEVTSAGVRILDRRKLEEIAAAG